MYADEPEKPKHGPLQPHAASCAAPLAASTPRRLPHGRALPLNVLLGRTVLQPGTGPSSRAVTTEPSQPRTHGFRLGWPHLALATPIFWPSWPLHWGGHRWLSNPDLLALPAFTLGWPTGSFYPDLLAFTAFTFGWPRVALPTLHIRVATRGSSNPGMPPRSVIRLCPGVTGGTLAPGPRPEMTRRTFGPLQARSPPPRQPHAPPQCTPFFVVEGHH